MWTGKPTPQTSFRNDAHDAELEALRLRGLVKHSPTNTKLKVKEAAADAALRVSLDCRRKERETRLRSESPEVIKLPSPVSSESVSPPDGENDSDATSAPLSVPPLSQTTSSLQVPAINQQQEQAGEPGERMTKKADDENDGSVLECKELDDDDDDDDMDTIISGVSSTSFNSNPIEVGSESESASPQATNPEAQFSKQMETILVEYNTETEQPVVKIPEEDRMVDEDDTYQREDCPKLKNRSPAEESAVSPQDKILSHEEVKSECTITEGRSSSGIPQYRRRRNRILALAVLTATSLAGITGVHLHNNPQAAETVSNWLAGQTELTVVNEGKFDRLASKSPVFDVLELVNSMMQ